MASMFDLVMNSGFTRDDWSRLGKGETEGLDVEAMLADGYENIVDDSDNKPSDEIEFF